MTRSSIKIPSNAGTERGRVFVKLSQIRCDRRFHGIPVKINSPTYLCISAGRLASCEIIFTKDLTVTCIEHDIINETD